MRLQVTPEGPSVRKTEGGVERSRSRHRFVHTLHKTFSLLKNEIYWLDALDGRRGHAQVHEV